jgi:hypothetical protein
MSRDWKGEAERARASARAGRWDLVQRYVDDRAGWFKTHEFDRATAEVLFTVDREIESRLLAARAAAKSLLDDVSSTRRAAGLIRAKLLGVTGVPSSISRRV